MLQEHLLLPRMPIEQGRERTGFCKCFCLYLQAPAQCKQAGQALLRRLHDQFYI